ncbi:hypothetical protein [Acidianus bottle-shaped virus]|uniref:Uncharacterized protein ORF59 n=1 Tax=Acidianus bottle-shaped virus (isolate Italy/Pozzuoli) TaxID=654911 RepID=Y059_ABVP|nr:hypothetical protein ABV_gp33 [Acidianus bottle-shaped virus]A4ZUB9.1 RecName: Full=Uncharacterized protein ORF59; Flags: Precursor [Acidianus bottle-shaped virus (isolate Pozzuoli)]ABP73423.1 hypothetical protein [Acidianus bottle-shaped virus]
MYLFYVLLSSLFLSALIYVIGKSHPNLFMFISLFVNVVTILYLVFKDYGQYIIAKPINT